MLIYNITYCVDRSAIYKWDDFVEHQLKPYFKKNEYVDQYRLFKVLTVEEGASPTFCFQLEMKDINAVRLFKQNENELKSLVYIEFQDSCLSFETVLKDLD